MKYLFRLLFTGAILLVSLMIFNGQKSEGLSPGNEHPDIELAGSQAEICFARTTSATTLSYWRSSGEIRVPSSEHLNDPEYLVLLKKQMQIHRDLKPELGYQSGHYLQHHSPFEDPLIS
ncbi:MAG: hypothetical protein GQ579_07725 [Bacteroidales bacterium]|nr:hypothetical protein [Bacteroidales bacterium]